MELPLHGRQVLDLTRNVAGQYASMILGELGGDVIKVEEPSHGDDARGWGPPFWGDDSAVFLALNRNKRSITLDLAQQGSKPIMERLVGRSDVVIESFRPGGRDALGYGYEWARERNPSVIYCSITGFGNRGPRRAQPGYDPITQALSGLMSVTGSPGGSPVRVGTSIVDMGAGMWASISILGALVTRDQTGIGCRVNVSLYETALAWMAYHLGGFWATGRTPVPHGSAHASIAPYQLIRCQDGEVMIGAANDSIYKRLCNALNLPELSSDPPFAHNSDRVLNRDSLIQEIERVTSNRRRDELIQVLDDHGVPCAPLQAVDALAPRPPALGPWILQTLLPPHPPAVQSVRL